MWLFVQMNKYRTYYLLVYCAFIKHKQCFIVQRFNNYNNNNKIKLSSNTLEPKLVQSAALVCSLMDKCSSYYSPPPLVLFLGSIQWYSPRLRLDYTTFFRLMHIFFPLNISPMLYASYQRTKLWHYSYVVFMSSPSSYHHDAPGTERFSSRHESSPIASPLPHHPPNPSKIAATRLQKFSVRKKLIT